MIHHRVGARQKSSIPGGVVVDAQAEGQTLFLHDRFRLLLPNPPKGNREHEPSRSIGVSGKTYIRRVWTEEIP